MTSEISGGMKKRVGLARAIIRNPEIILYDEPTAGLDPPTARTICELAMKLRDLEGVSSIFVTHRIDDARQMASEFVTIDEMGELIERLLPAEVAHLDWNDCGNALLHDRELGSTKDFAQRDRDLHLAGQVGIVELIGVAEPLVRR